MILQGGSNYGGMLDMAQTAESSKIGLDRRALIKKAGLAAGAVWVAPAVLTTAAGAQTQTCYFAKIHPGVAGCTANDPTCPAPAFATQSACGHPTLLTFSVSTTSVTATVAPGCDLKEIHIKAGNVNSGGGCTVHPVSGSTATLDPTLAHNISHANVVYCCTDTSA